MYLYFFTALLAGFYPAIFFLSNNWHIFSWQQSLVLLSGACLIALAAILPLSWTMGYVLRVFFRRPLSGPEEKTNGNPFIVPLISLVSLLLCAIFLRGTLAAINARPILVYALTGLVVLGFVWNAHKKGLKPTFFTLLILSSLAAFNLMGNIYAGARETADGWLTKHKAVYDQVRLKSTPDVYLIIAEAYPSRAALKAVYDFDNDVFYRQLTGLGFKVNHDFFSNYNHTLSSLPSLFGMAHHFGSLNLGNLDSLGGRRMLEAKAYNPVIDMFRANHYKIQYLHEVNSLLPNGADVDVCLPAPSLWYGLNAFLLQKENPADGPGRSETIASLKDRLTAMDLGRGPYFTFIYVNLPGHSPSRVKERTREGINKAMEAFRSSYGSRVESANKHLLDLAQLITSRDPDSIVIIIGDHGSWGFRLREDADGKPVSTPLFILDRFGVLAAMYAPNELSGRLENGELKSHVNLFRHVFAYLSGDRELLSTMAPDHAFENEMIMAIEDGNILDNFVKIVLVPKSGNGEAK
ncbi:MAG: hypothetical protein AB1724_06150 [Thermodesulfobacteriota bacterium]